MKTREEVEQLKRDWLRDPCYDLFPAPAGFEQYEKELFLFQRAAEQRSAQLEGKTLNLMDKIGGALAFPTMGYNHGMSYRQWLIGQALACVPLVDPDDGTRITRNAAANVAICRADAVLRKLAQEQLSKEQP